MKFNAYFRCSEGCNNKFDLLETIYRCPECKGLLSVEHDMNQLKSRSGNEWKKIFDSRYMKTEWPYGSGVWGKKEFVLPNLDNSNVVSLYEGGTNLFWAERLGNLIGLNDLWVKQCGNSHTGSFKDLGMTVLVSNVKQKIINGDKVKAVICASTGDTSASLAAYCAAADIPAVVILPKSKISNAQLIQPISNAAYTISLNTDFDGCMKIIKKLSEDERFYLANSINSLRIEGQKTLSIELVQQFDWQVPDWVIVPGGNLGNVSAIGIGFKMMFDLGIINKYPRIICAQSSNANPLYISYINKFKEFNSITAKQTSATAIQIGNPVSYKKAIKIIKEFNGVVEEVNEEELVDAVGIADKTGLFTCPQTGVALGALIKSVKKGLIKPNDKTVVISTANGLKFTDFKTSFHENRIENVKNNSHRMLPVEINPEYSTVLNSILEKFS